MVDASDEAIQFSHFGFSAEFGRCCRFAAHMYSSTATSWCYSSVSLAIQLRIVPDLDKIDTTRRVPSRLSPRAHKNQTLGNYLLGPRRTTTAVTHYRMRSQEN